MTKVLTMGKATQDVFLRSDEFDPKKEGKVVYAHLPLGAKLEVEEVIFSTGGNAMNAAVTFARHGLDVDFMTQIGNDPAGQHIIKVLDQENIGTRFVDQVKDARSSYSSILLAPTGERTILNYHGSDISGSFYHLPDDGVDWVYISSLNSFDHLVKILKEATTQGIKAAFNPGGQDLSRGKELAQHIGNLYVFVANKEEYQLVFGEIDDPAKLVKKAIDAGVNYAILTDGPNGSWTSDGSQLIRAGMYEDVVPYDRTGAGDAFASGFAASLASGAELEQAVTFASANSTSVVAKIGATTGILKRHAKLHDMPLHVSDV